MYKIKEKTLLGISIVFVFVVINFLIWQKEDILSHGTNVYLRLAPVDPRSLMQGDYMILAYEIDDEIRMSTDGYYDLMLNEIMSEDYVGSSGDKLIISIDENGIANFSRFAHKNDKLEANEKTIKYTKSFDGTSINIIPNSFMFQEGHASFYDQAKFAIFTYKGNNYVLAGLADENRTQINP